MKSTVKKIDITTLPEKERNVLLLIQQEGKCLYGNIFRKLSLSPTKGSHVISSLINKGYLKKSQPSLYLLDVELTQ